MFIIKKKKKQKTLNVPKEHDEKSTQITLNIPGFNLPSLGF